MNFLHILITVHNFYVHEVYVISFWREHKPGQKAEATAFFCSPEEVTWRRTVLLSMTRADLVVPQICLLTPGHGIFLISCWSGKARVKPKTQS